MSSEYNVSLKAQLDTTDVQNKLQQLGTTGGRNVGALESAVKSLEQAIQKLSKSFDDANQSAKNLQTTAAKANSQSNQLGSLIGSMRVGWAGHQIQRMGHALAGNFENMSAARAGIGTGLEVFGAGITAGAAAPGGLYTRTAAAAAAAATKAYTRISDALQSRAKAEAELEQTTKRIAELKKKEEESAKKVADAQASAAVSIKHERDIRGFDLMSDEELKKRRSAARETQTHYENNLINGVYSTEAGVADAKTQIAIAKQIIAESNRILKARKDQADSEEKAAEMARERERNQVVSQAQDKLSSLGREQMLENFGKDLETMSVADLDRLKKDLTQQKQTYGGSAKDLFEYAATTGSASDYTAAENMLSQYEDASSMLSMVEGMLGGISGNSWQDNMKALGSEAEKGYDVGGYGKLDEQMLKAEQETKEATKASADTLRSINTKLDEVKNVMTNGNLTAKW